LSSRTGQFDSHLTVRWLLASGKFQATFSLQKIVNLLLITVFGQILDNVSVHWVHMKLYIEESLIAVGLRSQSCLKVRPERRKKEVKRKLNRELTAIGYSPFFLTFSGRFYIKAKNILVKPLMVSVLHS
jgi:energy-converting hydrogenase Eha subunit E